MAALTIGGGGGSSPLKSVGKIDCDEMEWKFGGGNLFRKLAPAAADVLDSDDDPDDVEADSANPLKILASRELPSARKTKPASAQSSANGFEAEASGVPESALLDSKIHSSAEVLYAKQISSKVDETKPKVRFIPFRSAETKPEKSKHQSPNPTRGLRHTPKSDRPIKNRQIEVMPLPNENYSKASVMVSRLPICFNMFNLAL